MPVTPTLPPCSPPASTLKNDNATASANLPA